MHTHATAEATLDMPSLRTTIATGDHTITADEPPEAGGANAGATPMQLLLASLASCTTMTIAMYAGRKQWPLARVAASARGLRPDNAPGPYEKIELSITLEGDLSDEQRQRIMSIATRCPVHRTLHAGVPIETTAR
ncbi:MAG: OsmC family protein [Phycisphaerales bacterium]